MMRILLLTAGTRGDVEPFAILARRAADAGHDVRIALPDNSGADLTSLDTLSLGVDFTRVIAAQGVSPLRAMQSFRAVVRPLMRAVLLHAARAALEYRPDVVVYHPKILSAPLVADALGVPHVLAEMVPSVTDTGAFPAAGTLPRMTPRLNRLSYRLTAAASGMFARELDEVRQLIGAKNHLVSDPHATLLPISPAILPPPADWPDTAHMTGPWLAAPHAGDLDSEVSEFIAGGPFVYAGFGSMAAGGDEAAERRAEAVVRTTRQHDLRVLVAEGLGGLRVPRPLRGADVLVVDSVPHGAVFPHATAAIHHGGIGTVHAAMRAGVPSILVPFIADQPFWGARLHERGLAPRPIRARRLTANRLDRALSSVEQYRARVRDVEAAMADEDGCGRALAVLEGVAR